MSRYASVGAYTHTHTHTHTQTHTNTHTGLYTHTHTHTHTYTCLRCSLTVTGSNKNQKYLATPFSACRYTYMSSYYYICVLEVLYICPHTTICARDVSQLPGLILLYAPAYYYMSYYTCVLILLYMCALIPLYVCPHTTIYVSSY